MTRGKEKLLLAHIKFKMAAVFHLRHITHREKKREVRRERGVYSLRHVHTLGEVEIGEGRGGGALIHRQSVGVSLKK